ncbi:MAG: hypothetical protein R3Y11_00720 [Pseudomonadota bacterium]
MAHSITYTNEEHLITIQNKAEAAFLAAFEADKPTLENAQLIPLRQLELFKEKSKLEANTDMSAAEKAERIAKIDAALEALNK